MEIKTKFSVGDKVYTLGVLDSSLRIGVREGTIHSISISCFSDNRTLTSYRLNRNNLPMSTAAGHMTKDDFLEDELFLSREELYKSFLKE